jgi:hypothetical protein
VKNLVLFIRKFAKDQPALAAPAAAPAPAQTPSPATNPAQSPSL